jgi:hypothetical protein
MAFVSSASARAGGSWGVTVRSCSVSRWLMFSSSIYLPPNSLSLSPSLSIPLYMSLAIPLLSPSLCPSLSLYIYIHISLYIPLPREQGVWDRGDHRARPGRGARRSRSYATVLVAWYTRASASSARSSTATRTRHRPTGTQFTCFTSTKVQKLTRKAPQQRVQPARVVARERLRCAAAYV